MGKMTWTKEPPTEPGWYWWREDLSYNGMIVWVSSDGKVSRMFAPLWLWLASEMGGQWFGPLQVPGGDETSRPSHGLQT